MNDRDPDQAADIEDAVATLDSPDTPARLSHRQSLIRLRQKVRARAGIEHGEGTRYTEEDLIQVQYPLAKRELDEKLRADVRDFERLVEAHLGVPWPSVAVSVENVCEPHIKPVLRLVGAQLAEHADVEFVGANPEQPPSWERFELGEVELVPSWVSIYWDAGTVSDQPLVLQTWSNRGCQVVKVYSRAEDSEAAKAYLDRLVNDGKGSGSPYRGRLLKASWGDQGGVQFEVLPDPSETRDQLVFPQAIWDALDLNVHRMFERMPTFRSAGLGSNRGVLLAGAPGTGKTAVCKVLAGEILGTGTAVFVQSKLAQALLPQLYKEISGLSPALVLLEDLDLLVGARHEETAKWALLDFLTVLDGLMTQHEDVVTIATTNDPDAVDAGVRRAARFDRIITFPVPDEQAREQILEVYLGSIDHRVDVARVARAAEGKTGADLREYVRSALLAADGQIDTEDLLRVVEDLAAPVQPARRPPPDPQVPTHGKYL